MPFYLQDADDAMLATMALCLSVCTSQVGVLSKWLNQLNWIFIWEIPSTFPILC